MPPAARGRKFEAGFTLLEVLIAFVIAALALGVMFDAALGGLRATETASRYQEALSLARSHLAAVAAGPLAGRESSGEDGRGFRWSIRIRPLGTVPIPSGPDVAPSQGPQAQATLYGISVIESWRGDGG